MRPFFLGAIQRDLNYIFCPYTYIGLNKAKSIQKVMAATLIWPT